MNKTDLNGTWRLCWDDLRTGSLESALERFGALKTVPAKVPGSVHQALVACGKIDEPLVGLNSAKCGWMEKKEWWFIREFTVAAAAPGERFFLCFDGIDLDGKVWLNGRPVGTTDNAFVEFRFDVTESIRSGSNVLVVRLDEGVESVRTKPVDFTKMSWNNGQPYRAWLRKPQYVYGWDWTPWLPSVGLWKDVYLESSSPARIADAFVRVLPGRGPVTEAETVDLSVSVEIEKFRGEKYRIECGIFTERGTRAGGAASAAGTSGPELRISVRHPRLWWPNGMGRPYLYTIVLLLKDATGKTVHRKSFRYGIRTVALEERELGKGHKTFTFLVNGEPVFAKGANWVPVDAIPGRITAGKYRALVAAAAEAHVNMFRVWGGGVYESEEFFDLCDRFGILVWHDFMYSCGYYPSHDRGFRRNIGRESELAIRRLRNRASLAGWAGNNEIQCMYQGVKKWHPELDMVFHGEDIFEKILPGLIRRLDPDRPYRPGCPYGGYPSDSGIEGDQHTWRFTHVSGHADYLNLWMHTEEETKFLSEFGVLGPMGIETVDKCLPRGKRNTRSAEWHHHSNSYKRGLQSVILRKYFGSVKRWPLKKYILRGQALQAELMRYIFEELRSRKFHCSGALMWSWSDSFGTNGWSLIDYYLKKKPAYHYFRRALTPLAVGWSGYCPQLFPAFKTWREYYAGRPAPLGLLVMNDLRVDRTVEVECRVMTFAGKVLFARTVGLTAPANRTVNALSLEFGDWFKSAGPDRLVVAARLSSGKDLVHENRYFLVPMRDLRLKSATVAWTKRRTAAGEVELRLTADTFVWMAHLASPDGVEPLDNDFDLLPGETKTVRVRTRDAKLYVPGISSLNPGTRAVRRS